MKPCPFCTGTGKTARLVCGDSRNRACDKPPYILSFVGIRVRCTGELVEQPCRTCAGTGKVTAEKFAELTEAT